jgi:hypothetical protein
VLAACHGAAGRVFDLRLRTACIWASFPLPLQPTDVHDTARCWSPLPCMAPAGALPADVAAKAGHTLAARHLRAAADGSPTGEKLPSREALVERFLSPGGGSRRGRRLGGPNRSIKLAPGEAMDRSLIMQGSPSKGDLVQAAALAAASLKPTATEVRDVLAAAASSAFFSPAAAAPTGGKGEAAGRDRESSMHGGGEGLQARRMAALRRLVQRGFEGWGTPGGCMCVQCRQHACQRSQPQHCACPLRLAHACLLPWRLRDPAAWLCWPC